MNGTTINNTLVTGLKEQSAAPGTFTFGERGLRRFVIFGVALLVLALVAGALPRLSQRRQAAIDTTELAVPNVTVVSPSVGPAPDELILPAEVKPWQEASIFSRVNGYLKDWVVDIGAHVNSGQLLAEIDTPDLDHQLEQARSQAALAVKSFDLAKVTNVKWQRLYHEGVVSDLDAQNTATNQDTTKANADAFAANLRVLEQQVAFKRVTAPFAGTVTARNVNVGDLITANNTSMEMFHIQQTDPLRIYFRVPQANADDIHVGQPIDVILPDQGGRTVQAKVATTSESITPNSRTLLVELHLDNPNSSIQPGSYARVRLTSGMLGRIVTLPNNALLFRAQGLQVGVVKADDRVELRDIKVGRDFGTTIEIVEGVSPSEKVILNPADSLVSGEIVHLEAQPAGSPAPAVARK
ncbi:MAG TPA: efflux RND transporter periplasmic adaptor subunit [Bryobacteraceae bacterium]|jgi:RND family efflux transporter MFP subunit|nr:efflux RND transporter periplasmic adaptor subunit [Bryobacteraceae bacterium]